ncbi:restriction endonuclease subunit S [Carboxydothermus pertinax]|uniref:Type I restriction modification DNA specificity domain-containing protein n=1 Tax=Carboxydothermus pertinax TaxID=870242 RepID=A0A1L8CUY3_9THEO|nr:restriction endonuclease subunit S [Carboxydothermus pertinax]GAV22720.1 hypothetical protein cpu_12300 [Carboxydothermus pertinax]
MNEDKKVPEGWKRVKLGYLSSIKTGNSNVQDAVENGMYPLFDRSGEVKLINNYIFDCEAVILPGEGVEFVPKYFDGKFNLHQRTYAIFDFEKEVSGKYLYYTIFYYRGYFSKNAVGSTVKSLRLPIIRDFKLILPTLSEQQKIAEVLETVDNAIEKTDAIIEKYKRLKQGLMQDLLTKGIDENWQIRDEKTHKFKDSPLGRIPEEWKVVKLGEVVDSSAGGTPSREKPEFYGGNIRWLKSGEINKKYIFDTEEKITKKGLRFSNAKIVRANTVVVAMYGATAGQVGIIKNNMATNQAVLALKIPNENLLYNEFLFYVLTNFMQRTLSNLQGSGQPNLSKIIIDSSTFILPPLPEQQRIAAVLSQIDEAIEKEQAYKEKLERIKKGLMEDLLTGRVRVNSLL